MTLFYMTLSFSHNHMTLITYHSMSSCSTNCFRGALNITKTAHFDSGVQRYNNTVILSMYMLCRPQEAIDAR